MAGKRVETPVTLTNDVSKLLKCFKEIKVSGDSDFITACNIAMLVLKHRQNKNQKQRILLFVASPINHKNDDIVLLGKKLRKNNVAIDVISIGNIDTNREAVNLLVNTTNNSNNSHLMEVESNQYIVDCLFGSPILNEDMFDDQSNNIPVNQGNVQQNNPGANVNIQQGGGLSQFERDINLAIQQSMEEEERRRVAQPEESKNNNEGKILEKKPINEDADGEEEEDIEAELEKARLLSIKEHEENLRIEKEKEKHMKESLIKNDDFMRDLLEEVGLEGDLNDVMKEVNQNNNQEKEGLLSKSNKKDVKKDESNDKNDDENEKFIKK